MQTLISYLDEENTEKETETSILNKIYNIFNFTNYFKNNKINNLDSPV